MQQRCPRFELGSLIPSRLTITVTLRRPGWERDFQYATEKWVKFFSKGKKLTLHPQIYALIAVCVFRSCTLHGGGDYNDIKTMIFDNSSWRILLVEIREKNAGTRRNYLPSSRLDECQLHFRRNTNETPTVGPTYVHQILPIVCEHWAVQHK